MVSMVTTTLGPLTVSETEVCRLVAQGFTDKQIATARKTDHRTVQAQQISAREKLGFINMDRNPRIIIARWVWENDEDFR